MNRLHSWNYYLNNGGVEKRQTGGEIKEELMSAMKSKTSTGMNEPYSENVRSRLTSVEPGHKESMSFIKYNKENAFNAPLTKTALESLQNSA